ncbi:MAG: glycosyltransferase [PVC group bacterium]|nr:glycosyltransferase [PVC group bacterium]
MSKNNAPFFSIIIPTYNRLDFLKTAINSVLTQSFENFELIIIDDGSTDQTLNYIKTITDPRIKYIRQNHSGVSPARNNGVLNSQGDFIVFLDSDDQFKKEKLEVTYRYINQFPQIKIFHTEEIWYRNGILLNQKIRHKKPDGSVFEKALPLCCIGMSTTAIKKDLFADIGLFDESMPACEDYDFWLRATQKYSVKLIPESLTLKTGGHKDQLSKKYPAMDKFRIDSINKIIKSGQLDEAQSVAAVKELKQKCRIYINGAKKRNRLKEVDYYTNLVESLEE